MSILVDKPKFNYYLLDGFFGENGRKVKLYN
jgi:hypothetical protein